MAGRNLAGTKDADDYLLGRGKVYFTSLTTGDLPDTAGWRFLGNAAEFVINVETEKLEHYDTTEGTKTLDKEVTISQKVAITNLTLEEFNFENMSLFFAGDATTQSNADAVAGVSPDSAGNLTITTQGRWYDLFGTTTGMPSSDIMADRLYDIGAVTIEEQAGGSTMVEGTDFTVDRAMGRIFVINGGNMDSGTYEVTVAANASAPANVDAVRALKNSGAVGALKFISYNAANSGHLQEWNFHKVTLKAEGDIPLLGDEWAGMQLSGAAEENSAIDANSPTLTVITYEDGVQQ